MSDEVSDRREYTIAGMSCEHCEASVREELIEVEGVEDISIDLPSGRVSVRGSGFSDADVIAAVATAGYELA